MIRNPVMRKELKINARSIRFSIALFLYAVFITGFMLWTFFLRTGERAYYGMGFDFLSVTEIFSICAFVQMILLCLIVPVITGASIAGERERQTLDLMLVTPASSLTIVNGKLLSVLLHVLLFVSTSLPAMTIAFLYSGVRWLDLILFMIGIGTIAVFNGAIGIWCSSLFRRTIIAVIMTILIELIFYVGTILFLYLFVRGKIISGNLTDYGEPVSIGWLPLILLLNPAVGFMGGVMSAHSGTPVIEQLLSENMYFEVKVAYGLQQMQGRWVYVSYAVTLLISFIFILLAARRIRRYKKKRR